MKKVRWGVIGCGGIAARRTIPETLKWVEEAEICSVMDIDGQRAKDVAQKFGIRHYCDNEQETLRQSIDAVYIATPQHLHCQQTLQAAAAGKHILCEKPMAISLQQAEQMENACKQSGVLFMLGFCMRNNPYNLKARQLVQSGQLGQIVMARAQLTCWYPPIENAWRQDISVSRGGCLIDMGTHCLDLLEFIVGSQIKEVVGFQDLLVHRYRTPIEDTSTVVVHFENGAHGIVDNYFNVPDDAAQNILEIYGTKGVIMGQRTIGQDASGTMFSIIQPQQSGYDANQVRMKTAEKQVYQLDSIGLYAQMVKTFCQCVLTKSEPPISFKEGKHSVILVDAIYRAVKEKRVISI